MRLSTTLFISFFLAFATSCAKQSTSERHNGAGEVIQFNNDEEREIYDLDQKEDSFSARETTWLDKTVEKGYRIAKNSYIRYVPAGNYVNVWTKVNKRWNNIRFCLNLNSHPCIGKVTSQEVGQHGHAHLLEDATRPGNYWKRTTRDYYALTRGRPGTGFFSRRAYAFKVKSGEMIQGMVYVNPEKDCDVNADGKVDKTDGDMLVDAMKGGSYIFRKDQYFDADGDGMLTTKDPLMVINHLNTPQPPAAPIIVEGKVVAIYWSQGNIVEIDIVPVDRKFENTGSTADQFQYRRRTRRIMAMITKDTVIEGRARKGKVVTLQADRTITIEGLDGVSRVVVHD